MTVSVIAMLLHSHLQQEGDKKDGKKKKSGYKTVELPIEERSCGHSATQLNEFIEAECNMIAADRQEKERADARNALEEYVYDLRSKLMDDLEPFVLPTDKDSYVFSCIIKLNLPFSLNISKIC